MRFSRYPRRAKKYGSGRLLSRLAARLAPTDYQRARTLKQGIRAGIRAQDPAYVRGLAAFKSQWNTQNPQNLIDDARAVRLYGRGGYFGNLAGSWLGGLVGNSRMGGMIGDQVGDWVSGLIPGGNAMSAAAEAGHRHFVGSGGYSMGGDVDMTPSPQVGSFAQGEVDSIRIRKREYLGAIKGSVGIIIKSLLINAGEAATFPTLARVAMQYEQYKMNGLIFWYKSTSGESSSVGDTAIGEIIMAQQSDPAELPPTTKSQLVNTDGSVQNKPSLSSCFGFECADLPILKVRHGDPHEGNEAPTLYDAGKFFLATEGMNVATTRVGELWVTYDVTLIRSRDPRGLETIGYKAQFPAALNGNLFGLAKTVKLNSLRMTMTNLNELMFPQFINDGTYVVVLRCIGAPLAASNSPIDNRTPFLALVQNGSVIESQRDENVGAPNIINGNHTDGIAIGWYVIRVNAPDSSICKLGFNGAAVWQGPLGGLGSGILELDVYRVPDAAYP